MFDKRISELPRIEIESVRDGNLLLLVDNNEKNKDEINKSFDLKSLFEFVNRKLTSDGEGVFLAQGVNTTQTGYFNLVRTNKLRGNNENGGSIIEIDGGSKLSVEEIISNGRIIISAGGVTQGVSVNASGGGTLSLNTLGSIQLRPGASGLRIYKADGSNYVDINAENLTGNRRLFLADGTTTLVAGTMLTSSRTLGIATSNGIGGGATGLNLTANRLWSLSLTGQASALHNFSENGLMVRGGPSAFTAREITVSGQGIAITNGTGIHGNPTIALTSTAVNTGNSIVFRNSAGNFSAGVITATLSGNASTASALQTTRLINESNFNGSTNIITNIWGASRTISIGGTAKQVNGGENVTWSTSEINAETAVRLANARTINGTLFNGAENITTTNWGTARSITIGGNTKSVNGSTNYNWTLGEIGVSNATLTLATGGIATGSQTWTANQGSNATFTVSVPGTDLGIIGGATGGPTITSSTGTNVVVPGATASTSGVVTTDAQTFSGAKTFTATIVGSITGNAGSANFLSTPRLINGVAFDGTQDISITASLASTLTRGAFLTGNNFNGTASTTWAVDATSTNTASKVVARDASGNFSAGTITANLSGNATTAGLASNINRTAITTGSNTTYRVLLGANNNSAGSSPAYVVTDANRLLYNPSTDTLTVGTVSGNVIGNVTGTAGSVADNSIGTSKIIEESITTEKIANGAITAVKIANSSITNTQISASAAIADTKLATISTAGKVGNSATTATSANTVNAIVSRDASGNFSAGTITATLSGNASTATLATNINRTGVTSASSSAYRLLMGANNNSAGSSPAYVVTDVTRLYYRPSTDTLTAGIFSGIHSGDIINVGTIQGSGGITISAGGTNNNITLTPQGTGTVNAPTFNATSTSLGGFQGIAADSVTTPSFTWTNDLDTGMYRIGSNIIGFSTGGTEAVRFDATNILSNRNIYLFPAGDLEATSVDTTRTSSILYWRGKYWNGSSSVATNWNALYVPTDTAGSGEWRLRNNTANRLVVNNSGVVSADTFSGNLTSSGALSISSGGSNQNVTVTTSGTGSIILDTGTSGGTVQLKGGANGTRIYNSANTFYTSFNAENLTGNRNLVLADGTVTLVAGTMVPTSGTGASGTWGISITGNAATANKLLSPATINGISFDGSTGINVPSLRATNGTTLITGTGVTSAVNHFSITNAATAGTVALTTVGSDTNIPLEITTKGTGAISIATVGGPILLRPGASAVRIYDNSNTYYQNISTGTLTTNRTLTLPDANVTLVAGTMVPTSGAGAAGTWGISISGSAGSITSRTLWGQSFNGTQNISGNLNSVGNITGTGGITITAGGVNTSITLTPQGTGTVNAPTFNATSTSLGGFQGIAADTVTTPSFTWTDDLDTGMYRTGTNGIGFATGGTPALTLGTGTNFCTRGFQLTTFGNSVATNSSQLISSAQLSFIGRYWNGASSIEKSMYITLTPFPHTGGSELRIIDSGVIKLAINSDGDVIANRFVGTVADSGLIPSSASAIGAYTLAKNITATTLEHNSTANGSTLRRAQGTAAQTWSGTTTSLTGTWKLYSSALQEEQYGLVQRVA
jgi:hypothetical protein